MSSDSQYLRLEDENTKIVEETMELTTDDECTGQRGRRQTKRKLEEIDINVEKIISKQKSESMFELRKLSHQHHPVSAFDKKGTFEDFFSSRTDPSRINPTIAMAPQLSLAVVSGAVEASSPFVFHPEEDTQEDSKSSSHNLEAAAYSPDVQEPAGLVSERVQQFNQPMTQSFMPNEIRCDMQGLMERQIVHEMLQGPAEEIDRALRVGMEDRLARRRPRPRPRPRPHVSHEENGDDGGDEMGGASSGPMGRLMSMSRPNRRGRPQNRHVHFAAAMPIPDADGHYPVPRRDQSVIVDRLRQSPTLNSLGDEARDEILAEVSSLVSRQLVTSALSGEFRGTLELHIQSRAQRDRPGFVTPPRRQRENNVSDNREALVPSAQVQELREEMMSIRGTLNEMKQMMKLSFDLQLDIQRSIRQEVAAALSSALSQQSQHEGRATPHNPRSFGSMAGATAPGNTKVVDSGRCVICSEGVIDSVIYHCGHMATCIACGLEMKSKSLKCPICRAPITDVIRAFTSMI